MLKKITQNLFSIKNIPIVSILLIAAFLRLYKISEYLTFLGDEGRDVLVVKHILDGNLTLLGPTASVGGFFLGPIYYYMMAPFLFIFNYNPLGPAFMVALIGVLTVWLLYKVAKEFFGYYPAIITALLYALSPLVIIYSRSSWNPNPVPFFTLLMLYSLYKGVIRNSFKLIIISGILLGVLLQLHYLTTFLGVIAGIYLFISTFYQFKKIGKSIFVLGLRYALFATGAIIGWSPFLLFELRHGFLNIQSIIKFVFTSGDTGNNVKYFETVQNVFLRLFGRLLVSFPRVEDLYKYPSVLLDAWSFFAYLLGISAITICIYKLFLLRKDKTAFLQYVLILTWIIVGIFLFGFYKKAIYDYYLGILFPAPFLLFGAMLSYIFGRGKMIGGVAISIVIGVIAVNLYFTPIFYPRNNQLKQVRDISEFVLSKTGGKPYNFAVISSGGNSDHAYRFFFEINNHPPVTIEYPGIDPKRKTVTDQLLIVCETLPCEPLGYGLWEVAGFGRAEIAGEWPVSVIRVYRLVHYKGK